MPKPVRGGDSCAIARTVDVLKDPWAFLILRESFAGVTRFADFRANLHVATDVLTDRLHGLVDAGILRREDYQEPGTRSRAGYQLTAAGQELAVVVGALQQWGDAHLPVPEGPTVERRQRGSGEAVEIAFVDHRGRRLDPDDVEFVRTAAYPA